MTRLSISLILGVIACGLGGYGLGSGWIRFGPPGHDRAPETTVWSGHQGETPETPQPQLLPIAPIDLQVVRAQAAAAPPATPSPAPRIIEIRQADPDDPKPPGANAAPTEYVTRDFSAPTLLRSPKFAVVITPSQSTAKLAVGIVAGVANPRQVEPIAGIASKAGRFDFDLTNRPISGELTVLGENATALPGTGTDAVNVIIPKPGVPVAPALTRYANGTDADPAPLPGGADKPPYVTVFGKYLKLFGQDVPSSDPGDLVFLYYAAEETGFGFKGQVKDVKITIDSATRTWVAELALPELALGARGRLFAVAKSQDTQAFSKNLDYQRAPIAFVQGQTPTLDSIYLPGDNPAKPAKLESRSDTGGSRFYVNSKTLIFGGTGGKKDTRVLVYLDGEKTPVAKTDVLKADGPWQTAVSDEIKGENLHTLRAATAQGDQEKQYSVPLTFLLSTQGPTIDTVSVSSPGLALGAQTVTVQFKGNPLEPRSVIPSNFTLQPSNGTGVYDTRVSAAVTPDDVKPDDKANTVTLQFKSLKPDVYRLSATALSKDAPNGLRDLYGNAVAPPLAKEVSKAPDQGDMVDGIPKPEKAPNAVFPEFNNPRPEPNGFNPSDKVDTRVVRLYYYRDARRVAEIINRDLKSYNQAAVDTRRRLAEKARTAADILTDQRRTQEVKAVRAAQASREAQHQLEQAQTNLAKAQSTRAGAIVKLPALTDRLEKLQAEQGKAASQPPAAVASNSPKPPDYSTQIATVQQQMQQEQTQETQAEAQLDGLNAAVQAAQANLQSARAAEAQASDETLKDTQQEDRAHENQFRLEVAAAQEDPNSYVPGKPDSVDPVLQVSVSVIGEGVIQLRGPIKGVNIIRRMINQMDMPAGQVRIGIHTVQINGERGKRMEKVAARIQDFIDHARFLTVQSAQMLRNAVVKVASQKAEEAAGLLPENQTMTSEDYQATQAARDAKYQVAFFGRDFINELKEIDAEFLHTGNKVLSLHSMDTTSLAAALFLLALAKNDTRIEILDEFQTMLEGQLPEAEQSYLDAAARSGHDCHKFPFLSLNAKFQSFKGFFNNEVVGTDTINPLQREFIRLAQVFKSQLVTEMEFNQRVKERGLIEDRLGNYIDELRNLKAKEQKAKEDLEKFRNAFNDQREKIQALSDSIDIQISAFDEKLRRINTNFRSVNDSLTFANKAFFEIITNVIQAVASSPQENLSPSLKESLEQLRGLSLLPQQRAELASDLPFLDRFRTGAVELQDAFTKRREELEEKKKQNVQLTQPEIQELDSIIKFEQRLLRVQADHLAQQRKQGQTFRVGGIDANFVSEHSGKPNDPINILSEPHSQNAESRLQDHLLQIITTISESTTYLRQFNISSKDRQSLDRAAENMEEFRSRDPRALLTLGTVSVLGHVTINMMSVANRLGVPLRNAQKKAGELLLELDDENSFDSPRKAFQRWMELDEMMRNLLAGGLQQAMQPQITEVGKGFKSLFEAHSRYINAQKNLLLNRRPLDHKKFLDMLIDDIEDKYIELLEGTRAHTANVDNYIKAIATALDDDLNTQFYYPAFAEIRKSSQFYDVQLGQVETTNILTNNRTFAKVEPQATMEFDLPKRDILINEAMNGAMAITKDFGALVADSNFLGLTKMLSGQPTSSPAQGFGAGANTVRNVLPGLPRSNDEQLLSQAPAGNKQFGAAMEALIPDPAIYKFETGTGFEIRPVIQPDGQAVVFHFNYMYTTNVREPVRADEKHLGRVKRHFIDTDVQLGNYELREVSRYTVALKAARTSRGVPLFEDIPGLGILFRPLPSAESSLQQNLVMAQATIFPTLFDLMGLRYAPAVSDLDTLRLKNEEFLVRGRARDVANRVFDYSSSRVDDTLRVRPSERRPDLYRTQETIPDVHPNGYRGPGLNLRDSQLQEGYDPTGPNPPSRFIPDDSRGGQVPTVPGAPSSSLMRPPSRESVDAEAALASGVRSRPGLETRPGLAPAARPALTATARSMPVSPGADARSGSLPPLPGDSSARAASAPTTGATSSPPVSPLTGRAVAPAPTRSPRVSPGTNAQALERPRRSEPQPRATASSAPGPATRAVGSTAAAGRSTRASERPARAPSSTSRDSTVARASAARPTPDAEPKTGFRGLLSRLRGTSPSPSTAP